MRTWLLFGVALLAFGVAARAVEVEIKGAQIEIPSPEGFVAVDASMDQLERYLKTLVPATNSYLAAFVTPEVAEQGKAGNVVDFGRYFSSQGFKNLPMLDLSASDFAQLRAEMIGQNEKMIAEFKKALPEAMSELESNIKGEFNVDAAFKLSSVIPLKPHLNTERAMAFSMLMEVAGNIAGQAQKKQQVSATVAAVRAKKRLMYLYTFGSKADLKWTQDQNTAWIGAVLAANGIDESKVFEAPTTRAPRRGFDWGRVMIWAVIGGAVGGIAAFLKKKKLA